MYIYMYIIHVTMKMTTQPIMLYDQKHFLLVYCLVLTIVCM